MSTDPERNTYVYVTYIRTTPERLWEALTSADWMRKYWFGIHAESTFTAGAPWKLVFADGRTADTGEVLEADPPRRLVLKWRNEFREELKAEGYSRCVMELVPEAGAVRLTITHSIARPGVRFVEAISGGWPKVISNLKSLLETGQAALSG
ncbi:MAG: SRPBCC family protein [Proteobacteria bacterium]|nr:SRPBCC family protein [Pseudomonadota bacterium]